LVRWVGWVGSAGSAGSEDLAGWVGWEGSALWAGWSDGSDWPDWVEGGPVQEKKAPADERIEHLDSSRNIHHSNSSLGDFLGCNN
jgi:hypothetical protein